MERVVETGEEALGATEGLTAWQRSTRYASSAGAVNRACVCVWMGVGLSFYLVELTSL